MNIVDVPVAELLPHDPPMVLLDRAVSYDEQSLLAEVEVRQNSMLCGIDGVPAWVGIEYMAQAVAAHAGFRARLKGAPPEIGYLLGTRTYTCSVSNFPVGVILTVRIESLFTEMGLGAFACSIEADDISASATINVYQPPDGALEAIESGKIS